ncbi:hypothetical protein Turpa_3931 [Turneriella parva DSM 21527]|uniref:Alginate export domain-containing protein n=2 Tax=Turneriella TaxID=338321 RepID=I4BBA8_TURPD|nr:hypothetical protein Turpa_3931 [Turneriella parva DSM 21527]
MTKIHRYEQNVKKIAFFSFLGMLITPAYTQAIEFSENTRLNYKGNIGMNYWYFPKAAPKPEMPEHVGTFDGQLDLNLKAGKYWEFRANPRGVVDIKDQNRRRFLPQDIYADFVTSRFELRAGYQVFSWKTVESVAHSDILNQTDPSLDFFDAPKVGEPALRTRFIIGDENPHTFEVYYLPYFTPAKLPIAGNRFDFSGALPQTTVGAQTITPNVIYDPDANRYETPYNRWRPQGAVRYQKQLFGKVDTSLYYFNGYKRFPQLYPVQATALPVAPGVAVPTQYAQAYNPIHQGGLTWQGTLDALLIKGDVAYIQYVQPTKAQNTVDTVRPYAQYTVGFEYTFNSLFVDSQDLGLIVEALGDSDTGRNPMELDIFRPFQNHVFAGLRYTFNNTGDRSLLVGTFTDYKKGDMLGRIEYEERFFERVKVKAQFLGFATSTGSQLKPFEHTTRGSLLVSYYF